MKIRNRRLAYVRRDSGIVYHEEDAIDPIVSFFYGKYGNITLKYVFNYPIFSKLLAQFYKSRISRRLIRRFIERHNIDSSEFELDVDEFRSFNDFFKRRLRKEARSVDSAESHGICPVDGRALAFENTDIEQVVQIKNEAFRLDKLMKGFVCADDYEGGSYCIFRLRPADYHRFHFIDGGRIIKEKKVRGRLYSVHPLCFERTKKLYIKSKKHLTLFDSKNFGHVICVEIGASCIGSIVQTNDMGNIVNKGEEKGYFQFGGSSVLLFFQKDKIKLAKDLLENTARGYESEVKFGEFLGEKR